MAVINNAVNCHNLCGWHLINFLYKSTISLIAITWDNYIAFIATDNCVSYWNWRLYLCCNMWEWGFESLPHRQIVKTDLRVGFLLQGVCQPPGRRNSSSAGARKNGLPRYLAECRPANPIPSASLLSALCSLLSALCRQGICPEGSQPFLVDSTLRQAKINWR